MNIVRVTRLNPADFARLEEARKSDTSTSSPLPHSPIFKKRFLRREPSKEMQAGRQRLLLVKSNQNKHGQQQQHQEEERQQQAHQHQQQEQQQSIGTASADGLSTFHDDEKRYLTQSTLDDTLKQIPLDQFSDLWQMITRTTQNTEAGVRASSSGHLQGTPFNGLSTFDGKYANSKKHQLLANPTLSQVLGIAIE